MNRGNLAVVVLVAVCASRASAEPPTEAQLGDFLKTVKVFAPVSRSLSFYGAGGAHELKLSEDKSFS